MYAVNLSDGYVIVSATKEFYPIVAEIDHGSYPEYETGTGFDLLRDELIDAIDASAGKEIPEYVRDSWRMFESVDNFIPKTRSMSDDYYDAYVELADYATANGYTMYKLGEARERELPEELIEYFEAQEDTESPFLGEYSFDNTAYILERYVEDPITYGPYVTTKWDQGTPFNSGDPRGRYLGCLTVATGQYMRYNESPSRYVAKDGTVCEWSQMPDTYSSPSLSVFLYDLRRRLSINDGGDGYLINAKKTLDTLQYNVSIESYNSNTLSSLLSSRISNSSSKHKIAIMTGSNGTGTSGHAWVCDGYRSPHYYPQFRKLLKVFA